MAKSIKFNNGFIDSSNLTHKYGVYPKRKTLYDIFNNMLICKRVFLSTNQQKFKITINTNPSYTTTDKDTILVIGARNDGK